MLMDSSLLFATIATISATVGFFSVYKRFRFHPQTKDLDSSSSPYSSLSPSSSSSCKWTHDIFLSFRGEDVRKNFLSHIHKEFFSKGIIPFIDNDIRRGESIGPELIQAIRRSKIAVVLISRNYASSKWCLDELVEIMKCKEESGQIVFVIFYEVDPSCVKKLAGEFGAIFKKTCAGKTKEDVGRWRQAFAEVATIAGYDSRNWDNDAVMIKNMVAEIFKRFFNSTPARYLDGLIGMGAHMEAMTRLLCLESDEVRMIGIWGPAGIGKTTIARAVHDQFSHLFQLSVFMDINTSYARPSGSDDYNAKLNFEEKLLSQLTNQKDLKISHLGTAQNFLKDKQALVVLDGVDQLEQLVGMPKAQLLGPGTRIIITTQDLKILKAFEIKHIYKVNFPSNYEAIQIFCMSAFDQTFPKDGFLELAWEITNRAGRLPLGLRIMGSHLRGMSKEECEMELPRLRILLDGEIGGILKLSYDALGEEDKDLFRHIACFFSKEDFDDGTFEDVLRHKFSNVRQGLQVLVQRSLISRETEKLYVMHSLLVQLGREIVRKKSIDEPGKRQFLIDAEEISEVLSDNTGSGNVIGIDFDISSIEDDLHISENAFEKLSNLQFLRFHFGSFRHERLQFPHGLEYLSPKLRILDWNYYPMKNLPSTFNPKFLVKIELKYSKLEKLWEGIGPLRNLKRMDLSYSKNLKELHDLSTATNLQGLNLQGCSNLVELPSSFGNLINLTYLNLEECSNLLELPSSFGNLINLKYLNLQGCSNLVELPSCFGDLTHLDYLKLSECSNLMELPSSFGNLINLTDLNLKGCSNLVELPFSFGNLINLKYLILGKCSNLVELPSCFGNLSNLTYLDLSKCSNLVELPSSFGNLTNLEYLNLSECSNLMELPSSFGDLTNLNNLKLSECSNLVELPSSFGDLTNLQQLELNECSNLVELPSSIENLKLLWMLSLQKCSKLEVLPININLGSLKYLSVSGCSQLRSFPEISTNIEQLTLGGTLIEEVPLSVKSWSRLKEVEIPYCKNLGEFPNVLNGIIVLELNNTEIEEFPPWFSGISRLKELVLKKCRKLVSLPYLPDCLESIDAENCDSLESLACFFPNPKIIQCLNFINCPKLNEEARDIIVQSSSSSYYDAIFPGREVPAFFTYRSTRGGSVKANFGVNSKRFRACISLVRKGDKGARDEEGALVNWKIVDKQSGLDTIQTGYNRYLGAYLTEHLYTFRVNVKYVNSGELFFEFELGSDKWEIAQCGVRDLDL